MADLSINMLPSSDGLDDDSLLPVYQYNRAHKIRGELIKQFARASVEEYVSAAQNAAAQAEQSAKDAQASADSVAYVTEKAEEAAQAALAAQQAKEAAETARDEAQAIAGREFASTAYVDSKASTAESNAKAYADEKIAAIPTPDVSGQINTHNTDAAAHSDIRTALNGKATMAEVNAAISAAIGAAIGGSY